ncbi:MAG: OmpH family outer membrane protein [Betaproteobacteria bacterium]|nr:OmpH family outer membrane protein [Betaproteobacteria bacterium]
MNFSLIRTLSFCLIGMTSLALHADEFRVGFVNTDRIFREANTAKVAQTKLEQDLSDTQRSARQRQLADQDREFQRKRREFQEDLNARKNEELQQVLEKANKVVKQVAEAEKYDLILQEAVYIHPKHDITDKVIKVINSGK